MNQTLAQIERYVTEAFDHLTVALEPVDERDRPAHIHAAACCFYRCFQALMSEYAWARVESKERR